MRVEKDIAIAHIIVDRWALEYQTFDLAKKLEQGLVVPPIHIAKVESGRYKICDGRHRITAHKILGRTHIKARFAL